MNRSGLPNLVFAGAPKCGTSSVYRWLSHHPDARSSSVKETYYFVDPGSHMFSKEKHFSHGGVDGYLSMFPDAGPAKAIFEATPSYIYYKYALDGLANLPSPPLIMFILREPANQVFSLYRYFKNNWSWISSDLPFEEYVRRSLAEDATLSENELAVSGVKNAKFVDYIDFWKSRYPGELKIALFEDVMRDKKGFMKSLCATFGMDPTFYDSYEFGHENETYEPKSRSLQRFNQKIRSKIPGGPAYTFLRSIYRKMNTRKPGSADASELRTLLLLSEYFRESVDRLRVDYGLDLSAWDSIDKARRVEISKYSAAEASE